MDKKSRQMETKYVGGINVYIHDTSVQVSLLLPARTPLWFYLSFLSNVFTFSTNG